MNNLPSREAFDQESFAQRLHAAYDFRGEIGVLSYGYSKRIAPLWRFATPDAAAISARQIKKQFTNLLVLIERQIKDHVRVDYVLYNIMRMDICRKFLLMGYTRSMRYYYHSDGIKWGRKTVRGKTVWFELPHKLCPEKLLCARIFDRAYKQCCDARMQRARTWYHAHIDQITFDMQRV